MSPERRPILVIAYKFPPYAGVGGFRWAKLSKYLARLGHEVHVVTVPWARHAPNTILDSLEPGIVVHRVASGGPHRLRHQPISNRWLGAARALTMARVDRTLYWDDEAQRWGAHVIPAAHDLIAEHGLEVVIATGHPFQANRWAARLKSDNPELTLIQDFRDPWADNPFRGLRRERAAAVRGWQREAVAAADAVVAVTPSLLSLYLDGVADPLGKVISNGVDPEDIDGLPSGASAPAGTRRMRLTHIGNISNGRDRPLEELLAAVRRLEPCAVEVELVGGGLEVLSRRHEDLVRNGILILRPPCPPSEALRRVAAAHYALQLNAREFPFLVSTKVYEYALLRVPVLSLNYGGEIDRLVTGHGFGHSVDLNREQDLSDLLRSLPGQAAGDRAGRFMFDVAPFTHPALARDYSALIESL